MQVRVSSNLESLEYDIRFYFMLMSGEKYSTLDKERSKYFKGFKQSLEASKNLEDKEIIDIPEEEEEGLIESSSESVFEEKDTDWLGDWNYPIEKDISPEDYFGNISNYQYEKITEAEVGEDIENEGNTEDDEEYDDVDEEFEEGWSNWVDEENSEEGSEDNSGDYSEDDSAEEEADELSRFEESKELEEIEEIEEDTQVDDSEDYIQEEDDSYGDWYSEDDGEEESYDIRYSESDSVGNNKGIGTKDKINNTDSTALYDKEDSVHINSRGIVDDGWKKSSSVGGVKDLWGMDSMDEIKSEKILDMVNSLNSELDVMCSQGSFANLTDGDLGNFERISSRKEIEQEQKTNTGITTRKNESTKENDYSTSSNDEKQKEEFFNQNNERTQGVTDTKISGDYKSVRDFVKRNPNCLVSDAYQFFPKDVVSKEIKLGRVYLSKGKLFI